MPNLLTPEGVQEKARVTVRFLHQKMADWINHGRLSSDSAQW